MIFISSDGCNCERAQFDPALRAQTDTARKLHADQQQQRHGIGRIGDAHPDAHIHAGDGDQDEKADGEADHLRRGPGREVATGHRIEHRKADAGDQRDQKHKRPVDLDELVRERNAAVGRVVGAHVHHSEASADLTG